MVKGQTWKDNREVIIHAMITSTTSYCLIIKYFVHTVLSGLGFGLSLKIMPQVTRHN